MNLYEIDKNVKLWLAHIKENLIPKDLKEIRCQTKKNERDLVTSVDKNVEEYLRKCIQENFQDTYIIGEESSDGIYDTKASKVWVIDPIDGTANFVKQKEDYCIMIAYFENELPMLSYIYNVYRDELMYAIRGDGVYMLNKKVVAPPNIELKDAMVSVDIRRMFETKLCKKLIENSFDLRYVGSAGLDGVKVATGCFGGYFSPMAGGPWDFAPMILIAEELDLHLSTWDLEPLNIRKTTSFMLCTKQIYEEIKEYIH